MDHNNHAKYLLEFQEGSSVKLFLKKEVFDPGAFLCFRCPVNAVIPLRIRSGINPS